MKYRDERRAGKRKRKAEKKEIRTVKRKKRRKKIKLAFKKLGEGALKVIKSPVFKSTIGLIGGKALDAIANVVPGGPLVENMVKNVGGKALKALEHADDPEKAKGLLKDAANEAKTGAVALGTETLGSQIAKVDNPQFQLALQKGLDYANQASQAQNFKELGANIKQDALAELANIKQNPLQAFSQAGNLVAPQMMQTPQALQAMALAQQAQNMVQTPQTASPAQALALAQQAALLAKPQLAPESQAEKVVDNALEFYKKYKNLLPQ